MQSNRSRWTVLLIANVLFLGMLSLYRVTDAAQDQRGQLPFSNSVEQRNAMIRELQEIKALLKEQNQLLRTAQKQHDTNTNPGR